MSIMRQSTTTTVNTRNATNNDSDFDAMLEDLKATVSRSNSMQGGTTNALNGAVSSNVSGYREVRRTVKDDATGESTTEYHIEYLHPANSSTHVTEYTTSPYYSHTGYGVAGQHNKEITYKYNTSNQSKGDWNYERSRGSDTEIEEILQDFQTPVYSQNQADRYQVGVINSSSSGFDNVPGAGRTIEDRRFREERRETRSGSAGQTGPGVRRELVFTGPRSREPSPNSYQKGPLTQQVYRYEKTTSTKTIGPDGTVLYDSGGDAGKRFSEEVRTVRSPSPQYLQYRETSPGKQIETVKYTTSTPNQPAGSYSVKQSSYSYSSNSNSQQEVPRTPPPHRSPSPVSFTQPPTPVRSSASRVAAGYPYDVPGSPTLGQKFSPSDPSRTTLNYNVSPHQSLSSYKYSTTTTTNKYSDEDSIHSKPRPFPTSPSPTPDQQPPKKLDELMASLGEVDSRDTVDGRQRIHTVRTETTTTTSSNRRKDNGYPGGQPAKAPETQPLVEQRKEETRNISGPPVYYPKGELFAKKEESMIQRESAGGGGKYKAKAKYQYESGSKYKESSDTKVVPVCIPCPCCCAAPCTIM